MNRRRGIGLLVILSSLVLIVISGEAQEKSGGGKGGERALKTDKGFGFTASSRAPIDITSDMVEADQKRVTFKGNVVAKQEDVTLYANTLVIIYDQETKKLKEIIATGNVKVVQQDRRATGQKVTFDQDKNRLVLDGDAVVREGTNVIRGERITFYVEEERSVVEPGKGGRVSTSITPPPKEEGKQKKPKEGEKK
jgi:lipopolysaccharide export system protein LptA